MKINNIIRWILFIPVALASLFILRLIETYANLLADDMNNIIMEWIIAILYSFLSPIIIVYVGAKIVPSNKNLVAKLMSISLIVLFGFFIYTAYNNNQDISIFVYYGISIVGSIIAFIGVRKELLD